MGTKSNVSNITSRKCFCFLVFAAFIFSGCRSTSTVFIGNTSQFAVAGLSAAPLVYTSVTILPYTGNPIISEELKESFSMQSFYGETQIPERVMLLDNGREAFAHRVNLISRAKEEILLASFRLQEGATSDIIIGALLAAADRGVKIDIILDGKMYPMPRKYSNTLSEHDNINYYRYNTLNIFRPSYIPVVFHDKYITIDDEYMIFGGRNMGDRYYWPENYKGNRVLDKEVLVYNTDLSFAGSITDARELFQKTLNASLMVLYQNTDEEEIFDWEMHKNYYIGLYNAHMDSPDSLSDFDYFSNTVAANNIALIYNPREGRKKESVIAYNLLMMAYNSERIIAESPYFTLTNRFMTSIYEMSMDRDVTLLTNSLASAVNLPAHSRYHTSRNNIFKRANFTIYEYQDIESSIHSKCYLFDNRLTAIGSFNLNQRSIQIDLEAILIIDSEEFNAIARESVNSLISKSLRVIDKRTYEANENVVEGRVPWYKRVFYTIMGYILALAKPII